MKKPTKWSRRRRNTIKIRVDADFKKFIEDEYPNSYNPERTKKVLDSLLYGKKKK